MKSVVSSALMSRRSTHFLFLLICFRIPGCIFDVLVHHLDVFVAETGWVDSVHKIALGAVTARCACVKEICAVFLWKPFREEESFSGGIVDGSLVGDGGFFGSVLGFLVRDFTVSLFIFFVRFFGCQVRAKRSKRSWWLCEEILWRTGGRAEVEQIDEWSRHQGRHLQFLWF